MNSRKTSLKYTLWEFFSYIPMFSFVANQLKSSLWWWNSLDFLLQTPSPSSCHTCSDTRQSCHCQLCQSTAVNTVAVHIVHHWCSHTNRSCSFCVFAHMQKCWKKEFGEESHLRCFSPVRGRRSCLIVLLFSLREWLRESSSWWHLGKRQKHFILWIWDRFWKLCFDSGCEKTRGNPGKKTPCLLWHSLVLLRSTDHTLKGNSSKRQVYPLKQWQLWRFRDHLFRYTTS